ncbi:EAL and HDOD domain-containing protein [Neptuniibacter halophilus]|uniref:EAL and HDOD domain-containing protein n=1 Tax=Neptuniibacter halophilus TaxID=651666 RepID=UPI0025725E07|nr:HDOD domain-containing protein [Neptuniibacter halophilus]
MIDQILLARQPILNADCETVGYELLYRDQNGCPPGELFDPTSATCEVLLSAYTGILHKGSMRTLPAFMNINEELLFQDLPSFAAENVVLEIVEDVPINAKTAERIRHLADKGFKIALDDFFWRDEFTQIMDVVDIVKIDVLATRKNALFNTLEKLDPYNITLLAEKVENIFEFHRFRKLGFQLFQGYFFAYPEKVEGKRVSGNELTIMELLSELNNPDATPERLQQIIAKDPRLAVRLIKIVNSATFSLQREISTITEAVVLLGLQELKRWALIVSLSGTLDVPDELCRELLIRSKMCEMVAPAYGVDASLAFLLGILSGADALFSIPMHELHEHISISDEMHQALTQREGTLGKLLSDVIYFSHYEWNRLSGLIDESLLLQAQAESIRWALESQKAVS